MSQYFSGNRARLRFNGKTVGGAKSSFAGSSDFGVTPIPQLGDPEAAELQDTGHRHTVTIVAPFVDGNMLSQQGFASKEELYASGRLDIEILAKDTGTPIRTFLSCRRSNVNVNVQAQQPASETITFMAITVQEQIRLS